MGALAGSLVGGALGLIGQNQTNQDDIGLQNAAENYNTQMSDTAAQRGVADLKAAGLNPILAAGGLQDSSPTISPIGVTSPVTSGVAAAQSSASSAMDIMKGFQDMDQTEAQTKLTEANTVVAKKNAGIKSAESDVTGDADQLYQKFKGQFLNWFQRSGLQNTNAKDLNPKDLLGNPMQSDDGYITNDQQKARASALNTKENP